MRQVRSDTIPLLQIGLELRSVALLLLGRYGRKLIDYFAEELGKHNAMSPRTRDWRS